MANTVREILTGHGVDVDTTEQVVVYVCTECGCIGMAPDGATARHYVLTYDMSCCDPATTVLWPYTMSSE